ncbi:hypothetical protein FF38_02872 [Lucilia cuprina]|uniref:Uncharacterized protein n=1 Tax=Lucilia cuprina TaxID=7375 RepID=A0A0L0CNK8_LUCCU|nr:hypothetical protein FF38_02872 [Lucilia cuprina]
MYWLDGFTFDDNLINNSFLSADSNGELSDNNHRLSKASSSNNFRSSNRKAQHLRGLAVTTKANLSVSLCVNAKHERKLFLAQE